MHDGGVCAEYFGKNRACPAPKQTLNYPAITLQPHNRIFRQRRVYQALADEIYSPVRDAEKEVNREGLPASIYAYAL